MGSGVSMGAGTASGSAGSPSNSATYKKNKKYLHTRCWIVLQNNIVTFDTVSFDISCNNITVDAAADFLENRAGSLYTWQGTTKTGNKKFKCEMEVTQKVGNSNSAVVHSELKINGVRVNPVAEDSIAAILEDLEQSGADSNQAAIKRRAAGGLLRRILKKNGNDNQMQQAMKTLECKTGQANNASMSLASPPASSNQNGTSTPASSHEKGDDAMVANAKRMQGMGFKGMKKNIRALASCNGDIAMAVAFLLSSGDIETQVDAAERLKNQNIRLCQMGFVDEQLNFTALTHAAGDIEAAIVLLLSWDNGLMPSDSLEDKEDTKNTPQEEGAVQGDRTQEVNAGEAKEGKKKVTPAGNTSKVMADRKGEGQRGDSEPAKEGDDTSSAKGNEEDYKGKLDQLADMGFTNRQLNIQVLFDCNGDVVTAVAVILSGQSGEVSNSERGVGGQ